jgi:hypothetical protein
MHCFDHLLDANSLYINKYYIPSSGVKKIVKLQRMKSLLVAVLLVLTVMDKVVDGNYVIEVAFKSWINQFKTYYTGRCCDRNNEPPCRVEVACDTRFTVCLQPFTFSLSNTNCPYGRYSTNHDPSHSDPDNITFTFGINIGTTVPNPMKFIINNDKMVPMRVIVEGYDFDDGVANDDLLDVIIFNLPADLTNNFTTVQQTGQYNVGLLQLSYRSYRMEADSTAGSNCQLLTNNITATSAGAAGNDDGGGDTVSQWYVILIGVCAILCLIFIIILNLIVIFLLYKRNIITSCKQQPVCKSEAGDSTNTTNDAVPYPYERSSSISYVYPMVTAATSTRDRHNSLQNLLADSSLPPSLHQQSLTNDDLDGGGVAIYSSPSPMAVSTDINPSYATKFD